MNNSHDDVGSVFPSVYYDDAAREIEFLVRAFGFRRRLVVPGEHGTVRHSELTFGRAVIMVADAHSEFGGRGPKSLGGTSGGLSLYLADAEVDAHCARARAAGAEILREPQDEPYGGRGYMARDPGGHWWYFGSYVPGEHWTE